MTLVKRFVGNPYSNKFCSDWLFKRCMSSLRELYNAYNLSHSMQNLTIAREVLSVDGPDATRLLHSLTTIDIVQDKERREASSTLLYGGILNSKGRLLLDCFIHLQNDDSHTLAPSYLIECTKGGAVLIKEHFKKYGLKSKCSVEDVTQKYIVKLQLGHNNSSTTIDAQSDTRAPDWHLTRQIIAKTHSDADVIAIEKDSFVYELLKHLYGIFETPISSNLPLPFDVNLDLMGGISWTKGCYLGQELISRTHFTGTVRRRILPFRIINEEDISLNQWNLSTKNAQKGVAIEPGIKAIGLDLETLDMTDQIVGEIVDYPPLTNNCQPNNIGWMMTRLESVAEDKVLTPFVLAGTNSAIMGVIVKPSFLYGHK